MKRYQYVAWSILIYLFLATPLLAQWINRPPAGTPLNPSRAEGLIGNWPMWEGAGSIAEDIGPNKNTGILVGGATWVGRGLNLDGTNGYVNIGMLSFGSQLKDDWSIYWWQNMVTDGAFQSVAATFNTGANTALQILLDYDGIGYSDGYLDVFIRDEDANIGEHTSNSAALIDNQWQFIVIVRRSDVLYVYVDGKDEGSVDASSVTNTVDFQNFLPIGAFNNRGSIGSYATVKIDSFVMLERGLLPVEVMEVYQNPDAMLQRPMIVQWFVPSVKIPLFYHHYKQMGN